MVKSINCYTLNIVYIVTNIFYFHKNIRSKNMLSKIQIIKNLLDNFCSEILDSEAYAKICRKIFNELEQHTNQPLNKGKSNIWAASIAHAAGSINLLFSASSYPHISVDELNAYFDTRSTTTSKKSLDLRDLLQISPYNDKYKITNKLDGTPADKLKEVITQQLGISEEDANSLLNNINSSNIPFIPKTDYSAITIIPKQKFWDWVGTQTNLEDLHPSSKTDYNVYLVPDIVLNSTLETELHDNFKQIFEIELARYSKDDTDFPKVNFMEFMQWFEIKSSAHVMDLTGELLDGFEDEDFFDDDLNPKDINLPPDFTQN